MRSKYYKKERNEKIHDMYVNDGLTYRTIGLAYGISTGRVRQIVAYQKRLRRKKEATA